MRQNSAYAKDYQYDYIWVNTLQVIRTYFLKHIVWANDPVWKHDDWNGIEGRGGCGYPPYPGGKWAEGGEVYSGLRRVSCVTINDRA